MVEILPLLSNINDDLNHQRCSAGRRKSKKATSTSYKASAIECIEEKCIERNIKERQYAKNVQNEDGKGTLGSKESIQKGLSPPNSVEPQKNNGPDKGMRACCTFNSLEEMSSKAGVFDKTQWERTRFAKQAAGASKSTEQKEKKWEETKETQMLAESKQSLVVRGEYLNELPKPTLTLLVVELMWSIAATLVWGAAAKNPMLPQLLAIINMLTIFLLILICLSTEYFRFQVRREDTKTDTRYFIPYVWRYALCETHIARAFLLCANITIMAFDNDFDIGSVIVLAATPVHLIIVSIHIFATLRPKRQ